VTDRSPHIRAVLRAVALMQCFVDEPGGQTLSELARRTDISVSTAHRLLATLTAGGVLRRIEGEERYAPGALLLALAATASGHGGLTEAAHRLTRITADTGESTSLAMRDGDCAVVLLNVPSHRALRAVDRPPGTRVPIHASALGKALIAVSKQPIPWAVRDLGALKPLTPSTITDPDALITDLIATRQRGWASADGEQDEGVRSIAVATPADEARPALAIGVHGPAERIDEHRILSALRETR
jgi:IclR family acetate operon transcriptional repressor